MSSPSIDQLMQSALAHHQAQRTSEAEAIYRRVLAVDPDHADALHYLGVLRYQQRQPREAWELIKRAMAISPQTPHYYCNAAPVLLALGRIDDAMALCHRALSLRPAYGEAFYFLGLAHRYKGEFDQAIACYRKAIEFKPDHAEAWNALGVRLKDRKQVDEAIECYERALAINPNFADAHNNIGIVLRDAGRMDESFAAYQRALTLEPRNGPLRSNIATLLKDMGELDQAIQGYRDSLALAPDSRVASNLLYSLLFDEKVGTDQLWDEHKQWNQTHARPLANPIRPHENDPAPHRRIRIGYVSPDFRVHPIGRFLFPLLVNHDHEQFEVFCYSDVRKPDAMTEALKSHANVWREVRGVSDEQVVELIRNDRVDMLVDLTMHMEENRMLVFACKPAAVQVTYLAYAGTTGLETMDYRLTDLYLDPPERDDSFYSEKSVRLRSYWCYQAAPDAPETVPPPVVAAGYITFGCLNNFCKMTPGTFAAWCEVLRRVADSRLILHARPGSHRGRLHQKFSAQGIDPGRVEFADSLPALEYLAQYNRIDIALDPFPYPGGTTTCDALWMGVPVITLPRESAISRGGLSILSTLRLRELVARDPDHYIRIAAELAGKPDRLITLRSTMRERIRTSPLMDVFGYKRDVEAAFRRMWHEWCFRQRQ
jgi:protein O-GlcNAc transferase